MALDCRDDRTFWHERFAKFAGPSKLITACLRAPARATQMGAYTIESLVDGIVTPTLTAN